MVEGSYVSTQMNSGMKWISMMLGRNVLRVSTFHVSYITNHFQESNHSFATSCLLIQCFVKINGIKG